MPCEYANSTTFNNIAGGYAGAPVVSFRKRASKCFTRRVAVGTDDRHAGAEWAGAA